jgi:hypothetical protein
MNEQSQANQYAKAVERDITLDAYVMVRAFLTRNELVINGLPCLDDKGNPIEDAYRSDEQIADIIKSTYCSQDFSSEEGIADAIQKAYENHHAEQLSKRSE